MSNHKIFRPDSYTIAETVIPEAMANDLQKEAQAILERQAICVTRLEDLNKTLSSNDKATISAAKRSFCTSRRWVNKRY